MKKLLTTLLACMLIMSPVAQAASTAAPQPKSSEPFFLSVFTTVYSAYLSTKSTLIASYTAVAQTLGDWWHRFTKLFRKKVLQQSKKRGDPLLDQLSTSKSSREKSFTQRYSDEGRLPTIAAVAGTIDRYEDDFLQIKKAYIAEKELTRKKVLRKAMEAIDDEIDVYMLSVRKTLNDAQHEAFFKKDSTTFHFIQDLHNRPFLRAMLN